MSKTIYEGQDHHLLFVHNCKIHILTSDSNLKIDTTIHIHITEILSYTKKYLDTEDTHENV